MMSYPHPHAYTSSALSAGRPSFAFIARQIYREGPSGFYRGLPACLLRAFPVNACAFFVYEGLMRGLGAEKVI